MGEVKYDDPNSCNKCSGKNNCVTKETIEGTACECETNCIDCGHEDYWAYGFFQSGQDGLNKSNKY